MPSVFEITTFYNPTNGVKETLTYEVGINEPVHPDFEIAMRITQNEIAVSACPYGCKIYADPCSSVRVLAHSRSYGCAVTL